MEEISEALAILEIDPEDLRCAYCGDKATEWDHLRPLVTKRRPTGFVSEIANLVPSCGKCNQSKGNQPWKNWMLGAAPLSPTGRRLAGTVERVSRLERFEQWRTPVVLNFSSVIPPDEWERYWLLCDEVNSDLRKAQEVADVLKTRLTRTIQTS